MNKKIGILTVFVHSVHDWRIRMTDWGKSRISIVSSSSVYNTDKLSQLWPATDRVSLKPANLALSQEGGLSEVRTSFTYEENNLGDPFNAIRKRKQASSRREFKFCRYSTSIIKARLLKKKWTTH